jgi:hypothetical protein
VPFYRRHWNTLRFLLSTMVQSWIHRDSGDWLHESFYHGKMLSFSSSEILRELIGTLGFSDVMIVTKYRYWRERGDWGLNLGLCTCKAGALLLEPHLQSILLWLFWRWGLVFVPRLASNCDSPISFFGYRWDNRCTPPYPAIG